MCNSLMGDFAVCILVCRYPVYTVCVKLSGALNCSFDVLCSWMAYGIAGQSLGGNFQQFATSYHIVPHHCDRVSLH